MVFCAQLMHNFTTKSFFLQLFYYCETVLSQKTRVIASLHWPFVFRTRNVLIRGGRSSCWSAWINKTIITSHFHRGLLGNSGDLFMFWFCGSKQKQLTWIPLGGPDRVVNSRKMNFMMIVGSLWVWSVKLKLRLSIVTRNNDLLAAGLSNTADWCNVNSCQLYWKNCDCGQLNRSDIA